MTLVGGSRNCRKGVGVRDILTKIAFFSLTILQRGPISRKTILFKVPEGGGGGATLFRVEPTFSWRGWGPFTYSNGNLCSHGS